MRRHRLRLLRARRCGECFGGHVEMYFEPGISWKEASKRGRSKSYRFLAAELRVAHCSAVT